MDIREKLSERVKALVNSGEFPVLAKAVKNDTIIQDLEELENDEFWRDVVEYFFLGFLDENIRPIAPQEYFKILQILNLGGCLWIQPFYGEDNAC